MVGHPSHNGGVPFSVPSSPGEPREERARRAVDRDILRLAVPSCGALVAEPLFVLADSAFIARVSTTSLAGLGLAWAGILRYLASLWLRRRRAAQKGK